MSQPRAHIALLVDFANLRQQLESSAAAAASSGAGTEALSAIPGVGEIARALVRFAGGLGRVGVARAYADWSREPDTARALNGTRLAPVLVPATDDGEDRSHIRLVIDAMEALYNGDEPDAYVIVSSDASLVPLVQAIRADGSEVVLMANDNTQSEEMQAEADLFVTFEEVLGGLEGEPLTPRQFRDRGASGNTTAASEPAGGDKRSRPGQYAGMPILTEPDFDNYDWSGFIKLIDELEQRLPFVGVRYLVNKVLGPHNCGIEDPHLKRDLINEAVDDGMIEMYTVGNVHARTDPVTACRLDRQNPLVREVLGEGVDDELGGGDPSDMGMDEDGGSASDNGDPQAQEDAGEYLAAAP